MATNIPEEEKEFTTGYQSQYKDQIQGLYDQIANRKDFTYDVNADAMYQQMKDQYIQGGRMAMQDTMGQAQAMTGGYGNSYAQSVGQQSYQGYLQGLNDQVPNLYQMALSRYIQQGDQLKDQYSMLTAQEAQDYARWQDQQQLALQQVTEMLKKGKTPSDELIAQSGLSKEYIDAMKKKKSSGWDPMQDAIRAYWSGGGGGGGSGLSSVPSPSSGDYFAPTGNHSNARSWIYDNMGQSNSRYGNGSPATGNAPIRSVPSGSYGQDDDPSFDPFYWYYQ
ncbi:MAG: hypothetical protein ACI4PL_02335 [Faecousia sp.]